MTAHYNPNPNPNPDPTPAVEVQGQGQGAQGVQGLGKGAHGSEFRTGASPTLPYPTLPYPTLTLQYQHRGRARPKRGAGQTPMRNQP